MFGFILKSQVSSLRVGFYDYKVLANPLTWIDPAGHSHCFSRDTGELFSLFTLLFLLCETLTYKRVSQLYPRHNSIKLLHYYLYSVPLAVVLHNYSCIGKVSLMSSSVRSGLQV